MEEESEVLSSREAENPYQSIINFKHKKRCVFDSDESDNNEKASKTTVSGMDKKMTENLTLLEDRKANDPLLKKSKPIRLAIIDSDDSETEQNNCEIIDMFSKGNKLVDSVITPNNFNELRIASKEIKADERNVENQQVLKNSIVYITNNKGQLIPENNSLLVETKNKLNALCDSDTSEDDNQESIIEKTTKLANIKTTSKRSNKNRRPRNPKEKTNKMTGKEALEQRKEIFNESQKRLRNLNVAIPYHKPKSRSLKEFLCNKPKISSTVPNINTPPSVAIKLASQQLNIITEKIKEHEKVVQVFYKSDSEPEDHCAEQEDKTVSNSNEKINDEDRNKSEQETNSSTRATNANEEENKISSESDTMEIENTETTEYLFSNHGEGTEEFLIAVGEEEEQTDFVDEDKRRNNQHQRPDLIENGENLAQKYEGSNILEERSESLVNEETMKNVDDEISEIERLQENLQAKPETNLSKENDEPAMKTQDNVNLGTTEQESLDKPSSKQNDNYNHTTEKSVIKKNKNLDVQTFEYDFNLDEVEIDNTDEEALNTSKPIEVIENALFDEKEERLLNNIIQNFTNIEESKDTTNKPTKLQLLKEKLNSFKQPKLSGNPDDLIIFGDDQPTANEITKLKGRFLNHTLAKRTHKNEVHTEVVCFDGGELRKETVVMVVDSEDEPVAIMEKPWAKHQKLRVELQSKIMKDKFEKWQTRSTPLSSNEKQLEEEKKCDSDLDYDEEEEALLTDSDLSDEEEDGEQSQDKAIQKNIKKCELIDEEAEESDDEQLEEEEENNKKNQDKQPDECLENTEEDDIENGLLNSSKKLKRIVKGFEDDDSDEEEKEQTVGEQNKSANRNSSGFNAELDSTQSYDEDDVLPAYQTRALESPVQKSTEDKDNFDFLTPVTFLTGLQSYSASKFLRESPKETSFPLLNSSQLKDSDTNTSQEEDEDTSQQPGGPQRKLVFDLLGPTTNFEDTFSQSDMDNIALLCSGSFSTQPEKNTENNAKKDKEISSCTGITQNIEDRTKGMSIDITKSSGSTSTRIVEKVSFNKIDKEVKNLNNSEFENLFISQLLDEEEMKNFKKKFESPVNDEKLNLDTKSASNKEHDVKIKGGRLILDSSDEEKDDEDCEADLKNKNKKITMKKITFSDDESDSDEENDKEQEEIDLHDDVIEDEEELNTNNKTVNYDSEENEIEDFENEDDDCDEEDKVPLKPSDFFENEAELSESEWGSEDEVENEELDKLEIEEGDKEKFDEVEMRRNLEKIHMRQMLDDDNREIKILQELLLEDGELHGSGRKRQFRWKDIDLLFGNDSTGKENDEGNCNNQDETDNEERWRKMRYYRELFLKEKMEKGNVIEKSEITLLSSSHQIMELGQKALERSSSASQNNSQTMDLKTPKQNSSSYDEPLSLFNKRGSFLSRTDKILKRMAELTKVPTNPILGGPKNSRNFVFKQVSEVLYNTKAPSSSKRKLTPETPTSLKKIKLSSTLNVD